MMNAMMVLRGHPSDYAWEADGCPGWSWATAEPGFRRSADGPFPLGGAARPEHPHGSVRARRAGVRDSRERRPERRRQRRRAPRPGLAAARAAVQRRRRLPQTCPPAAEPDRRHGGSRHPRRRRRRAGSRRCLSSPRRDGRRRGGAGRARGDPLRGSDRNSTPPPALRRRPAGTARASGRPARQRADGRRREPARPPGRRPLRAYAWRRHARLRRVPAKPRQLGAARSRPAHVERRRSGGLRADSLPTRGPGPRAPVRSGPVRGGGSEAADRGRV